MLRPPCRIPILLAPHRRLTGLFCLRRQAHATVAAADHHLPGPRSRQTLFWNGYALGYDRAWDSPLTVAAEVVADELSAATVIDLGCGTGLFAARFASRHTSVTGVDQSRAMLKRAVRSDRIVVAVRADAAHTGLPDTSSGSVICANILHLHPHPEAVLAEAVRLVCPGGRIAPPGHLGDILQRCVTMHRLNVVVERFIGRTQRILILEHSQ